jgi:endothelin-converting enzyme/putative endopeptidase
MTRTAILLSLSIAAALAWAEPQPAAVARPQDDFFRYVNGEWLDQTPIPAEWSSYGSIQIVAETTEEQLRALIADGSGHRAEQRKPADLYASFMDEARIDRAGLAPLARELARINRLRSHDDVTRHFGYMLLAGVPSPVDFYVSSHPLDPDTNILYLWQSGLGLPDRDYYLLNTPEFEKIRAEYRAHIGRMAALAGWPDAATAATTILDIETRLADAQWSNVQNRDRERIAGNRYTLASAAAFTPDFDWPAYLDAAQFHVPGEFVIAQTDYFKALGGIVHAIPVTGWQAYFRFRLLKAYAPYLNSAVVNEDFAFQGTVLRGQPQIKTRWKRAVKLANEALGELVGQAYVARHFPPAAKARMDQLINNLRAACGQAIRELEWMSPTTRQAALLKLDKFTAKIGYPERWRDYSALRIRRDDLIGNVRRAAEFAHRYEAGKLRRAVDRSEWGMTPQTVNAYYRPAQNEIVFPAAILQPPFFDMAADDAANYGAIGAIIGHEISHGFDDQGRKFDGDGRLRDWWTRDDAAKYQAIAVRLVQQYNAFAPLPDVRVNGQLTLGENIADLAGLVMAHRAYSISLQGRESPVIDGHNGEQRLYMSYARAWRSKFRDGMLREILLSDPHPPGEYRVRGVLQNMPEFYAAFDVREGDGMYLPPEARVKIW